MICINNEVIFLETAYNLCINKMRIATYKEFCLNIGRQYMLNKLHKSKDV